jgi:hypothetical protein
MVSSRERDAAEYQRHFASLVKIAAELKVPPQEAEEIINEILLSTLVHRRAVDIDTWLAAAFMAAVNGRRERLPS